MKKEMNSQVIVDIVKKRVGAKSALTQHIVAERYYLETGDEIEPRTVRKIIEGLRFEGYPILSTTDNPGGYHYPASMQEFYDWEKREMIKAKKQIAKIEPVRMGVIKMFHKTAIQQVMFPKTAAQRFWDFGKKVLRVS